MRLICIILIAIATACTSQNFDTQTSKLPETADTVEYLGNNPLPLPDFINEVTTEIGGSPAKICVKLNNGILGEYSEEQTKLIRNNASLYINMRKQESLEYHENMISLSDGEGDRLDTGISQICSEVSDEETAEEFIVYFELSFSSSDKYVHIWTVNRT